MRSSAPVCFSRLFDLSRVALEAAARLNDQIDLISKVLELMDMTMVAVIHFTFVRSAIGISFAEGLTRAKT